MGAAVEQSAPKALTIVVLEDEPVQRAVTSDYLRSRGYTVFEAATAVEAAEVLGIVENIDLVFADVNLPGVMGGLSFTVWMRERYPQIPVILTSGVKAVAPALKRGRPVPFVAKPYDLDQLAELIEATVSEERSRGP
jgi:CheY-like chemotaxis protein